MEAWDHLVQEFENKAEDQLFRQYLNFFSTSWNENGDAPTVLAHIKNQHHDHNASLKTQKIEMLDEVLVIKYCIYYGND